MRWDDLRQSDNVEDRRGTGGPRRGVALSGGGILLLLVISYLTGQNPLTLLNAVSGGPQQESSAPAPGEASSGAPSDQLGQFSAAVLGSTEDVWGAVFSAGGRSYQRPKLVLFSDAVESACGYSSAAVGPFYCPRDSKVYLDLSFFSQLDRQFGAPGDFARAYVIAHEVGHHVQNQLGISEKIHNAQESASEEDANALSVRLELQADCLAGVWANQAQRTNTILEPGDLEQGLAAASAIGDDQLQRRAQGYTVPETWTHGSSEMRVHWLRSGVKGGRIEDCNTFAAADLGGSTGPDQ
jgi:predicted metalloprotease